MYQKSSTAIIIIIIIIITLSTEVSERSNCRLVPYWREFRGVSNSEFKTFLGDITPDPVLGERSLFLLSENVPKLSYSTA